MTNFFPPKDANYRRVGQRHGSDHRRQRPSMKRAGHRQRRGSPSASLYSAYLQAFTYSQRRSHRCKTEYPACFATPDDPDTISTRIIGSYSKGCRIIPTVSQHQCLQQAHRFDTAFRRTFTSSRWERSHIRQAQPGHHSRGWLRDGRPDAHSLVMPPAPAFSSREEGARSQKNYWMALCVKWPIAVRLST